MSLTALQSLLQRFRETAQTEREKGTYFEELTLQYFRNEPAFAALYSDVWLYSDWAKSLGLDARDAGIDVVAKTRGTQDFHAIQCKFFDTDARLDKSDIDSFFTASGKKPFVHRIIVATTNNWTDHAEDALRDQQPPVSKIDLFDLENSQIDWARFKASQAPVLKPKKQLREHQESALMAPLKPNPAKPPIYWPALPRPPPNVPRDAITDAGLKHFSDFYPGEAIAKEDLFYFVYGLLHSPDYRRRYGDNLSKELPRIPRTKSAADFWAFIKVRRKNALRQNWQRKRPNYCALQRQNHRHRHPAGSLRLRD